MHRPHPKALGLRTAFLLCPRPSQRGAPVRLGRSYAVENRSNDGYYFYQGVQKEKKSSLAAVVGEQSIEQSLGRICVCIVCAHCVVCFCWSLLLAFISHLFSSEYFAKCLLLLFFFLVTDFSWNASISIMTMSMLTIKVLPFFSLVGARY